MKSAALLSAIKEYEASKWKVIGAKVGKPAKVKKNPPTPFFPRLGSWELAADATYLRRVNSTRRSILVGGSKRQSQRHYPTKNSLIYGSDNHRILILPEEAVDMVFALHLVTRVY